MATDAQNAYMADTFGVDPATYAASNDASGDAQAAGDDAAAGQTTASADGAAAAPDAAAADTGAVLPAGAVSNTDASKQDADAVADKPTLSVKTNGDGTFTLSGSGFVGNTAYIRAVGTGAKDYAYGQAWGSVPVSGGSFSATTPDVCGTEGGDRFFSANDGRPDASDLTGTLWSNTVKVSCPKAGGGNDPGDDPGAGPADPGAGDKGATDPGAGDNGAGDNGAGGGGDASASGPAADPGAAAGSNDDASAGAASDGSAAATDALMPEGAATATGPGGGASDAVALDTSDGTADNKKKPKGQGWHQKNVIVTLVDFDGAPLGGHEVILQFKAPGAEIIDAGGKMDGGTLTFSGLWLQNEGAVRVIAMSSGAAAIVPEGNTNYKLGGSGALKIKGVQQKRDVTVTAKTSEEAGEKAGAEGSAGIDYKVVKIEGKISGESESKKGSEVTYSYVVTIAKPAFDLTIQ